MLKLTFFHILCMAKLKFKNTKTHFKGKVKLRIRIHSLHKNLMHICIVIMDPVDPTPQFCFAFLKMCNIQPSNLHINHNFQFYFIALSRFAKNVIFVWTIRLLLF